MLRGEYLETFSSSAEELEAALILVAQQKECSEAIILLQACRTLCDKLANIGYEKIKLDYSDLAALSGYQAVVLAGLTGSSKVVGDSKSSALDMVRLAQLLAVSLRYENRDN